MKTIIVCVFGILAGLASAGITQAQWVAFNDHVAGTAAQTAANATTNDTRSAGGPYSLKEITTGTAIPGVQMTVTTSGGTPANGGTGGSLTGGPLYATFNTICYFGANLILISNSHLNTITFTGLNPSKRYKFMGGSVRGDGTRSDRWTKCNITGAFSVRANHQQSTNSPYGIISSANEPTLMSGYEVAYNSGINMAGDMIEWEDISPANDGSFSVTSTQWQYASAVNSHGTNSAMFTPNSVAYGFALDAFRLEELPSLNQPVSITTQPTNQTIIVGDPVSFSVGLAGSPPFLCQWRKNGAAIAGANNQSYTISNVVAGNAGTYSVLVTNAFGIAASENATLSGPMASRLRLRVSRKANPFRLASRSHSAWE